MFLENMEGALNKAVEGNAVKNLAQIGFLVGEMRRRKEMLVHPEVMMELAGAVLIREFTSLAIFHAVMKAKPEVFIAEIGLGGRLDAVNILEPDCSIVTAIDIDHAEWLGTTREQIGWEKAHIYRPGRPAICSDPSPPQSLIDYAENIAADLYL